MDTPAVGRIGDYIKEQRETASLSLRRLAKEAGVSNPYLSQVERGLRKPSAEILQQLAKALRISAEQLYVQAGLLEDKGASLALESAVLGDATLNERQKRVLLDIYASFVSENAAAAERSAEDTPAEVPTPKQPPSKRAAASKRSTRTSTTRKTAVRKTAVHQTAVHQTATTPPKPH